jgi:hypothetical protein
MSPIPDKREGYPFENDNMLMCKRRNSAMEVVNAYLERQGMYAQTQ